MMVLEAAVILRHDSQYTKLFEFYILTVPKGGSPFESPAALASASLLKPTTEQHIGVRHNGPTA